LILTATGLPLRHSRSRILKYACPQEIVELSTFLFRLQLCEGRGLTMDEKMKAEKVLAIPNRKPNLI